jgi:hypothetical protein
LPEYLDPIASIRNVIYELSSSIVREGRIEQNNDVSSISAGAPPSNLIGQFWCRWSRSKRSKRVIVAAGNVVRLWNSLAVLGIRLGADEIRIAVISSGTAVSYRCQGRLLDQVELPYSAFRHLLTRTIELARMHGSAAGKVDAQTNESANLMPAAAPSIRLVVDQRTYEVQLISPPLRQREASEELILNLIAEK